MEPLLRINLKPITMKIEKHIQHLEDRDSLFKQYKNDNPQTVGETDSAFDNDNFIDWLVYKTKELQEQLAAKEKEWISVEDDLKPDFYVKVLMEVSSDDTNYYDIGSYTRDGWHSHLRKLPNVIKWKYIH